MMMNDAGWERLRESLALDKPAWQDLGAGSSPASERAFDSGMVNLFAGGLRRDMDNGRHRRSGRTELLLLRGFRWRGQREREGRAGREEAAEVGGTSVSFWLFSARLRGARVARIVYCGVRALSKVSEGRHATTSKERER